MCRSGVGWKACYWSTFILTRLPVCISRWSVGALDMGCVVGWNLGMGIWGGRGGRITNVGINWPASHIGHPSLASWPLLKGDPKNLIGIDGLNPSHYIEKDNGDFPKRFLIFSNLFVNSGICQVGLSIKLSNREYPVKTLTLDPQLWFSKTLAGSHTPLCAVSDPLKCDWENAKNLLRKIWPSMTRRLLY